MKRIVGITTSSNDLTLVYLTVPKSGKATVESDQTWGLQNGERSDAYGVLHNQLQDFIQENKIDLVVIKASAVSLSGTKQAHLEAAEFRGVAMAAAASVTDVICVKKAVVSRTFGDRKADEYLKDGKFWDNSVIGTLRVKSREATLIALSGIQNL